MNLVLTPELPYLLTSVFVHNFFALLTFHLATPEKNTVAISRNLGLLDVMAASTAKQLTPIDSRRRNITLASRRPEGSLALVRVAVTGR